MSGIRSYSHTSNVIPQSKDDFCGFQDKEYKRKKEKNMTVLGQTDQPGAQRNLLVWDTD